jgi:hypothetical protein
MELEATCKENRNNGGNKMAYTPSGGRPLSTCDIHVMVNSAVEEMDVVDKGTD